MIYEGTDIEIIFAVNDGAVSATDKSQIETFCNIEKLKVGKYFDMSLMKNIGGTEESVSGTTEPIKLRLGIPEELQKDGRKFSVIRVHNGIAAVLADLDEDESTVTIETDKFSTYALVYSEPASALNDPEDNNSGTTSSGSTTSNTTSRSGTTSGENSETTSTASTVSGETSDNSGTSSDNSSGTSSTNESGINSSTTHSGSENSSNTSGGSSEVSTNPATGIAVSFVPFAAAVAFVVVTVKRKKK